MRELFACLLAAVLPTAVLAGDIRFKTGNYIGPSTTETSTISYQIFSGSTTCGSGGGSVVTVNHVDFATGQTVNVAGTDSILLTAGPGMPFVRSDQNGLFVGWQTTADSSTITYLPGDGRQVCVSGFDGAGTRDYFAQFYVGIETLDMCGNPKTTFAPGETMQFRLSGGIEIEPAPLRLLAAGGSVNECTFLPVGPAFTPVEVTADPQMFTFTLPASDADIPPACSGSGTQHIVGHWRIVAFDQSCGCNRNDVKFEVADDAPASSCVLTCPADITTGNDSGACGAAVSFVAPSGPGTVTCDHASGSFFPVGTTTVTCTSSLGSSCNFHVTVNDTQSPSITAPAYLTVDAGASCSASGISLGTPATSDNCAVATVTNNAPPSFSLGTTSVTWTVTDTHGQSATATQNVTVVDHAAPTVSAVAATPASLWPPNHTMADVALTYTALDNCGTATCVVASIASNELENGSGDGNTAPDWQIVDAHHVRLRAERAGNGSGRVYTITVVCTDANGNPTTRTATVTVKHN